MEDKEILQLSQVKFWSALVLSISSTICILLIYVYFYRQRKNISLHQPLTVVLITISFIQIISDFPFSMIYYHYGIVIPSSDTFCLWWNWWEYSLSVALLFVMAWGSFERHLLIFNNSLMNTRQQRFFFHVLLKLTSYIYLFIFYFAAILVNSCENVWDYEWVNKLFSFI